MVRSSPYVFKYLHEEMICLKMTRQEYQYYIKLRNVILDLGKSNLIFVYFPHILIDLDELAVSSNLISCFIYCVESLHSMRKELTCAKGQY